AIRMTRFTTVASTGRFTNMSVNFMPAPYYLRSFRWPIPTSRGFAIVRWGNCGSPTSRRLCETWASSVLLAVLRIRIQTVTRLHRVVHLHRRSVAQLEHSRADNLISGVQPRYDSHLVAARSLNFYNLLAHTPI